jgi:Bacteriocin-protection, YdeI or OmpD-Associated/Domain of unknown function (DUF1905)
MVRASLTSKLLRKDPRLPVYVVIPGAVIAAWALTGTTVVEGTANGHSFGRRNLKAWGKGTDDWFLDFTAPFCQTAGLAVGDSLTLVFSRADESPPVEIDTLLRASDVLKEAWSRLTDSQRRDASEHVRAAKTSATRERRAFEVFGKIRGA